MFSVSSFCIKLVTTLPIVLFFLIISKLTSLSFGIGKLKTSNVKKQNKRIVIFIHKILLLKRIYSI